MLVSERTRTSSVDRIRAHIAIARLDHSIKNLFVLPGVIVPLSVYPALFNRALILKLVLAFIAITLVACSNYVINEVLDAPFDRLHPVKRNRPAARGIVHIGAAYVQWILMMLAGIAIGLTISKMFAFMALILWIMGCIYNFPPIRTKDVPYLDVLTESINNPLRMLLGWYAVTTVLVPPVSLLIAYWMIGCYFMGLKRFSELSELHKTGDSALAGSYRASFKRYTPESLLVSVLFYASTAMLFLGAFIIRYRIELILGFPFVAFTMAIYLKLSFKPESAVQNPEKLYREPLLMASFASTVLVMGLLLFIRMPRLEQFFLPTLPASSAPALTSPLSRPVPASSQTSLPQRNPAPPKTLSSKEVSAPPKALSSRSVPAPPRNLSSRPEARLCAAVERPLYSDAAHPATDGPETHLTVHRSACTEGEGGFSPLASGPLTVGFSPGSLAGASTPISEIHPA